jgi:hypothetical protein
MDHVNVQYIFSETLDGCIYGTNVSTTHSPFCFAESATYIPLDKLEIFRYSNEVTVTNIDENKLL